MSPCKTAVPFELVHSVNAARRPDPLALGWLRSSTEELDEELGVPHELLAEIEAEPAVRAELMKEVAGTMFVDYRRGCSPSSADYTSTVSNSR